MIQLTEQAENHIKHALERRADAVAFRLAIKKSGCASFSYAPSFAQEILPTDYVLRENGAVVTIPQDSLPYLRGTTIDYVKQGLSHVFSYHNPNAENACGCGESFNLKNNEEST